MGSDGGQFNSLIEVLQFVKCPMCNGVGEIESKKKADEIWSPWGQLLSRVKHECIGCYGKGWVTV
ncbi:hypothetical protein LCGC14_2789590 [marine sediment metagenome]|uniref:Uncharacterized protein n=1 Tax=marine sediment metagenome TaxID=412755 RepID=A0A0F9BH94_9ZZZZ|nr:hypothetical protein [Candidatus Aminicenantes bacterium]